jgi:hypothetical protein
MAIALTVDAISSSDQNNIIVYYTLTFSGNYTAGGDTLNFQNATGSGMGASSPASNRAPVFASVDEVPVAGTAGSGYTFLFCTAASSPNQTNCAIQLFNGTTELTAGAYPAKVTSAVVRMEAKFPAFLY